MLYYITKIHSVYNNNKTISTNNFSSRAQYFTEKFDSLHIYVWFWTDYRLPYNRHWLSNNLLANQQLNN